ncbi:TetR/AcrR family transcriptional regulator [Corynebacterium breve]|uniref:TetR/AcrR family transcriptional regulator n=1 Tax=Corynebacterium breve TaxID=3049799 RepID=A0ABY8VFQ3_9CORY|nr:TetR/AcrR family transcriptional regulator [Corynebacterium breve]WIM67791.1 TetR/AcrR family transcriptional regulator [Corynebacterium breve]
MQLDSRTEIIYSVWAVIAEQGLPGVTMRVVAKQAGVSVGRVQHHFGTKENLILESCRAMINSANALYDGSLDHAITHVIPHDENTRHGAIIWNAYVAHALVQPAIAELLADAKRGQEDEVTRVLGDRSRARSLIAMADGLVQRVLIGDLTPDEAMAVVRDALES